MSFSKKPLENFDLGMLYEDLLSSIENEYGLKEKKEPEFSEHYKIDDKPELKEAMESMAPTVLFNGPWGCGKTRLLAEKAYMLAQKFPKYPIALVRKELKHLKRTLWKMLIDDVIPRKILDDSYYNKTELEIKLSNESEIFGCGLDDPQKLASTEFGFIAIEEAIEIQNEIDFAWIESRARKPGVPFHQVMYACNAGPPSHHLYRHFFIDKPKDENGNAMTHLVQGKILWDILPVQYKARLNMLKGKYRDRFVLNKWIGYEGLVYDIFDPVTMLVPRFEIPKDWTYVMAIDFGFNSPFCCQFWAISPDDVWYLEKEIYMTNRTVNQHSPEIKRLMEERNLIGGSRNRIKPDNGRPYLRQFESYSDHDAEDQATLKEHGIITKNAIKDVSPGIQEVYERMSRGQVKIFDDAIVEKDPILEMRNLPTCTAEEIQGYIWKTGQKDEPKKENDHGMDPMRYGIYSKGHRSMPGLFFAGGRYAGSIQNAESKHINSRAERWLRGD